MERRLAAVLAADVVGFSNLMAQDEEATVRTLQSHREVIDRLIERHDGRIFNTGGDSVLAEFGSSVEAVRCALATQDEFRVRNAEPVPDRRLRFRIGISGSTFEQVKNKLSVGFEDLGPQRVKNIPEPITAFRVTSGPATMAAKDAITTGQTATGTLNKAAWRSPIAIAATVVVIVAAAGSMFWHFSERSPMLLSAFPENISTDEMRGDDIEALMAGVTISGLRASDNQPFEIVLNADKTASYTFGGSGSLSGKTVRETGRWWAEDFRFCMQVPKFVMGRKACPRIVKAGQTLAAVRPVNGVTLPWNLAK